MSKTAQTAQQYWDDRSDLFGNYYQKPSTFDKLFRKAIYTRVAVAVKACKVLNEPTVLDIGSGPGINSVTILKNTSTKKIVGIDFASNMIKYANEFAQKEGVADKCEFIEGDFLNHDWEKDSFDVSIALGVFDYIENASIFIQKMEFVTKNSFVISWPENGFRMWLRKKRYNCPLYHYNEQDIRTLHNNCNVNNLDLVKTNGGWVSIAHK